MYKNQIIIAIIPARSGSKGIPNKNIIEVGGKNLITWTIEQSLESEYIDYTFVSTDNERIAEISKKGGAEIIKRPSNISEDNSMTEDAIIHGLDIIKSEHGLEPDLVVLLQVTSPLRTPFDIDNSITKYFDNGYDSLFSVTKIADLTLWEKPNNEWRSVNSDYKKRQRRQDREDQFIENGSIYMAKPGFLIENHNIICGSIGVYEMEFWQTWEIDTIAEVDLVEFYLNKMIIKNTKPRINKNDINLIVFDFDGVMTNNKAVLLENGIEGVIVNRGDGVGVSNLKKMGFRILILTSEANAVVKSRAQKLNLEILANIENKKNCLKDYISKKGISKSNVLYVGNDLNDLEVMKWVGYPICPADSHKKIKEISKIVLKINGGEGIARSLFDILSDH